MKLELHYQATYHCVLLQHHTPSHIIPPTLLYSPSIPHRPLISPSRLNSSFSYKSHHNGSRTQIRRPKASLQRNLSQSRPHPRNLSVVSPTLPHQSLPTNLTFGDLDYVCPFSAKLFNTLYTTSLQQTLLTTYSSSLVTIFRQQIQPWHPSSTLTHEAAYAVQKVSPTKFWAFSAALFAQQKAFFDANVVNETRNATYKRLAKIAGEVGVDEAEVYKLLEISDKPAEDGGLNNGNQVTNDVKVQVKANRLTGVHVTPTVVFDGVVNNDISSSWTVEQWEQWLAKNVTKQQQ